MNTVITQLQSENSILSNVTYATDTSQIIKDMRNQPIIYAPSPIQTKRLVKAVEMTENEADYYNFSIDSYGWYNIDILLKGDDRFKNSNLIVSVAQPDKAISDIYLVIPSEKIFTKGGKIENGIDYGFYSANGDIPLPQNEEAFVFAFGESGSKTIFGITPFYTRSKQRLQIVANEVGKEEILKAFRSYNFTNLNMKIDSVKKGFEIDSLNKQLNLLNNLKSNYCKCSEISDISTQK